MLPAGQDAAEAFYRITDAAGVSVAHEMCIGSRRRTAQSHTSGKEESLMRRFSPVRLLTAIAAVSACALAVAVPAFAAHAVQVLPNSPRVVDRSATYSSSRRIQDLRVGDDLIPDHPVQPVLGNQVNWPGEERFQVLL